MNNCRRNISLLMESSTEVKKLVTERSRDCTSIITEKDLEYIGKYAGR